MRIHKSAEDYLEMILRLIEEKGYARSVDIAVGLSVSKPSVSVAMKQLREGGYIAMDKDNYISLTDSGMEIAQRIYERHKVLTRLLMLIGVDAETAQEDACKVEHDISIKTFDAIKEQLPKMEAKLSD
ncbi:MAG: metal-dependent transcriptional regulator [Clostridia bacterium]|nr:metal-dependent transcriptional regulator [Clostridia bacterium]MBQ9740339.1 metal-dependent transcriptional regulator [Kiritimatiellia bacterium]